MRPNDTISRAEASKILTELMREINMPLPNREEIHTFSDVNPEETLAPYVQFAYNSCLLHGRNTLNGEPLDGKPRVFEPFDGITLAETAKVLYNITHSEAALAQKNGVEQINTTSISTDTVVNISANTTPVVVNIATNT